jgi:hypothetical protein
MTNRPLSVFLCHSSNDKPAVRELYQKLRVEPWIQLWLDEEERQYKGMKPLSTLLTFFIKISIPIVLFVCATSIVFFLIFALEYWFFSLLSAAIGFAAFWHFRDIKKVECDSSNIFVSNRSTEKIPFTALKDVYEDKVLRTSFIRLRFKYKTKFGQEIKFIPHYDWNDFFPLLYPRTHPTVIELRKMIK